MWLVFIIFFFPLMVFGTMGMRYIFLLNAARLAANSGAQCQTFLADVSSTNTSSTTTASAIAQSATSGFKGVTLTQGGYYIVTTPLAGGTVTRQSTPLSKAADPTNYAYNFEVVLQGQLQPLVPQVSGWWIQIPGLNEPVSTQARSDVFFENTQGLTQ
jgi:hypothetical protein